MPPRKRTSEAYDSDNGFVADAPATKKSKTKASASKAAARGPAIAAPPASGSGVDDDGNTFWTLNERGTRRVTINEFKGMWMVNIREMYEKDGKMLPGKKGISMPIEQYEALIGAMPGLEAALVAKGQSVSRPDYDTVPDEPMAKADEGGEGGGDEEEEDVKKNIEATSEEED